MIHRNPNTGVCGITQAGNFVLKGNPRPFNQGSIRLFDPQVAESSIVLISLFAVEQMDFHLLHMARQPRRKGDNVEVEPNRVYLLPPKKEMVIRNRRLLLTDKERTHGLTLPIDHFFRSLAQDVGPNAVGIILSGSGSDGSRGIREIKRMGGCVFVENPDSARFDGMRRRPH